MRKFSAILIISMGLALCGCGSTDKAQMPVDQDENISETEMSGIQSENISEAETIELPTENAVSTDVVQGGPYGEISISLPDGWSYEACPIDSDSLMSGLYGIHIYPENVDNGYIEIAYINSFGVCGTGLAEESVTVAGEPANIGTYDNNKYWDFIAFDGAYKGMVALTYSVDEWWSEYSNQVLDILDTLLFDQNVKEGGVYVYNDDSWIDEIELDFSLKNISSTGATLVFSQHDPDAPKGELMYGEDYVIEVKKDGVWEEAPIVVEGNYGFDAIAILIKSSDTVEKELDWEWLYGELEPGEYRIKKSVHDFIESGNFDEYMVYAYFILN